MRPIDPYKNSGSPLFPTLPMRGDMKKVVIAVMVIASAYLAANVYAGFR